MLKSDGFRHFLMNTAVKSFSYINLVRIALILQSATNLMERVLLAGWSLAVSLTHARRLRTCAKPAVRNIVWRVAAKTSAYLHIYSAAGQQEKLPGEQSHQSENPDGSARSPVIGGTKGVRMIEFAGQSPIFDTVQTLRPVGRTTSLSLPRNYAVHLHSIMILLAISHHALPHPHAPLLNLKPWKHLSTSVVAACPCLFHTA
jgi:hypothetical protein